MLSFLLFTTTGYVGWGESLYRAEPWPVPVVVCLGLTNLGVQLGTTGVVAYVADCHGALAAEAFAAMSVVKNLFAFGLTFFANDWIDNQGVRACFGVIAAISGATALTSIPMYVYGKRARSFVHRHRLVRWLVE